MPRTSLRHCEDQVYPIREDTLLLLEAALEDVRPRDRILEVGTGSGYIATELLKITPHILATDINPHAVRMAKEKGVEVVRTDLMAGICSKFDLIMFNPPYLPTVNEDRMDDWLERALDGGPSGRKVIERFAKDAGRVLAGRGRILLLVSSLTGKEETEKSLSRQGFSGELVKYLALEKEELFVYRFRYRKTSEQ